MATRKQNDQETPRMYLRAALQAPTALSEVFSATMNPVFAA
jgi:hypothetical protein